jgi:glycosyltransferase involved in cell wall biosynthesis
MEYKLSILIPTLESRWKSCEELLKEIGRQRTSDVEVFPYMNKGEHSIGFYRNELVSWANGEYSVFIDDDDMISPNYISTLLKGIESKPDAISLRGEITIDGRMDGVFEHCIKYPEWITTDNYIKYERYTNHLNCIKSSIAKQIKYPLKSHGEDHDYSKQLQASGLIKTEYYTDEILYYYNYKSDK